jgi:glutathione S-transferase
MRAFDVTSSIAATLIRLAGGVSSRSVGSRPSETLILYDFESCPFCRKVREALTELDLDARILPCPKRGERYRPELVQRGGKPQFPYLIDPNTGRELYESDDIVDYLYAEYGDGAAAPRPKGMFPVVSGSLASLVRARRGTFAAPSRAPAEPLELWSFEASPFCRLVRERLCELELPYLLHNVGKGSAKREAFETRFGRMQVPYLLDPNTGKGLYESAEIVAYLDATYAEPTGAA